MSAAAPIPLGFARKSVESPVADFVQSDSIVKEIWGNGDMVLLVFAGSAAEFALNRSVDWLFFTGRLPDDPINRLFSTASYSQEIVFADAATAVRTLARIRAAHEAVEVERGQRIPQWAYRDVLYMLIEYSEKAYEMLRRPLTSNEQKELYDVFLRVGTGLGIVDLPRSYGEWTSDRELHLRRDLVNSQATKELYDRYRRHLGKWRYQLLLCVQESLIPDHVRALLGLGRGTWLRTMMRLYPVLIRAGLRSSIQRLLVPRAFLRAVRRLDQPADTSKRMKGGAPKEFENAGITARVRRCPFHAIRAGH